MYWHDNGLDFWIVNEMKYPLLAPLAQDLLSAPASEAYVECVFSICGELTAGKRNRLMKGLEKRIFLKMTRNIMNNHDIMDNDCYMYDVDYTDNQ